MEYGIRVKCLRNPKEIHETLFRIGIPRIHDKVLWPSCHLVEHGDGNYYILHFKECFLMEGSRAELVDDDYRRRNKIINLLSEHFGMIEVLEDDTRKYEKVLDHVFVLSHFDKWDWNIRPKYIPRKVYG